MKLKVKWFGLIPMTVEIPVRYVPFIEKRLFADGTEGEVAARAHGTWIEILEDERNNVGLLNHELKHCVQWHALPYLHKTLRALSKRYTAESEAQAYAAQLATYGPDDQFYEARITAYAYLMANGYDLGITIDEARARILKGW